MRAVRAAVEMRDAVAPRLEVRIGVNTGEVVAGRGETLATGDAVNVAARLEQARSSREVLIGVATELPRSRLRADRPVGPLALKGKSEQVAAFRVVGLLDGRPHPRVRPTARSLDAATELARLSMRSRGRRDAEPAARDDRRSTRHREVAARARAPRRSDAHVLVGRCLPYGEGITYWPIQEIVAQIGDVRAVPRPMWAMPSSPRCASRLRWV